MSASAHDCGSAACDFVSHSFLSAGIFCLSLCPSACLSALHAASLEISVFNHMHSWRASLFCLVFLSAWWAFFLSLFCFVLYVVCFIAQRGVPLGNLELFFPRQKQLWQSCTTQLIDSFRFSCCSSVNAAYKLQYATCVKLSGFRIEMLYF